MKSCGLSAHEVLAHLAGQVPDELLELARDRLADGDMVELGRLVWFARAAYGCTVPPGAYDTVRGLFDAVGAPEQDAAGLVFPRVPVPPYEFHPVAPHLKGDSLAWALDLVAGPERVMMSSICDGVDQLVVAVCPAIRGLRGLWRSWRTPLGEASWPTTTRVLLAEVDISADPSQVRNRLREAARLNAVVEVLVAGARVPAYHQRARTSSALLWAAGKRARPRLAPMPDLTADREFMSEGPFRTRVLGFLASGVELPVPDDLAHDVVDPACGRVVPTGWRTDGEWVWPAAYRYYLCRHGIAPDSALLEHAWSRAVHIGEVDSVSRHQALAALLRG